MLTLADSFIASGRSRCEGVVGWGGTFYADYFADMLPKVHKFIRARFSSSLAEDLASETMLTLWRKNIPAPKNDVELRQLRKLTYKIATGHVSNAEKKFSREGAANQQGMLRMIPGDDPTFEAVVPSVVVDALAQLEFNDRQVVNLVIGGFRTREIAEILGITPKAASMRLARARERLNGRLSLGEEVEDDITARR
ncbi:RNA polymerase sigma factor [Nocardioides limicola]|uniref:RNA polymerase sigma factor n=1 Tax=Nocardioides limicola TaxID=2803368 RepID=UPI00193BAA57|nr:sigma-70 family RNA polymerase sigma factor [Nocardioides sp. DJM-14]